MIHSNTSFGKLKEVIVGRELQFDRRIIDITFKQFYKESLGQELYEKRFDGYKINADAIVKRNYDLDNLALILKNKGIIVHRPKPIKKVSIFQTPTFKSEVSSANNVRDITLVYNDYVIETPTYVRNRYFENMALYDIFNQVYDNGNGGKWIKAPNTQLTEHTIDLIDWKQKRDFSNIPSNYEMAIDGAQFLRIGKDVIVNVTTYNHYLGFKWVKSFFPQTDFHIISIADNHIDGALICLRPGIFLVDPKYRNIKDYLPSKFKSWKLLIPNEEELTKNIDITKSLAKTFYIDVENKCLYLPFMALDGLGESVANKIIEERNKKPFYCIEDFQTRGKVNQTTVNALKELGVFGDMPETAQLSLFQKKNKLVFNNWFVFNFIKVSTRIIY